MMGLECEAQENKTAQAGVSGCMCAYLSESECFGMELVLPLAPSKCSPLPRVLIANC